ncbi:lipocalin family protein [Dyella sp. S184]|jgi:apolipoprotein D and lipocalin family protein|uniref:lipocalin family protein n=1 Tax=Dyella sp. S184 TaxID=1641862 RepID=UPI00131E3F5E|nr:lipocalin family protein [Dyella sp. S184]
MQLTKSLLLACGLAMVATAATASDMAPIKPVAHVDLPRFMGSWYVIASIPSFVEKKAYNAIETYTLQPDGRIGTSFRYRNSSFDNPVKTIHSTGFVTPNTNNAVWGVQLIWPIKAQYLVAYLDDNYSETIIARDKRDYVWIMARTPTIPSADYDTLVARVKQLGYTVEDIRKVPQAWPETGK